MTIKEILKSTDIDRLDAEVLLSHILSKPREWLITNPESNVTPQQLATYQEYVKRRQSHEPIAYITGIKEFYGRDFIVTPDVLIPRPATEGLIDLTLDFLKCSKEDTREVDTDIIVSSHTLQSSHSSPNLIVDLCTGSGCIAVTLALETSNNIIATDISPKALDVAAQNAKKHGVEDCIEFREGSLLEPIKDIKEPFIIVTNPPYIPEDETLMQDVADYEPHLALFGGIKGDECVVKIINSAKCFENCAGVVVECRSYQL